MKHRVLVEPDEDGVFVATVPSLPGCVADGLTRTDAISNVRDAIALYDRGRVPRPALIPPAAPASGALAVGLEVPARSRLRESYFSARLLPRAMRLALAVLLAATASAQAPDAPLLAAPAPDRCADAVAMPALPLAGTPAPIRTYRLDGPVAAPIPNVCAEPAPLAALPDGVRLYPFRVDPDEGAGPPPVRLDRSWLDRPHTIPQLPPSPGDRDAVRQRLTEAVEFSHPPFRPAPVDPPGGRP